MAEETKEMKLDEQIQKDIDHIRGIIRDTTLIPEPKTPMERHRAREEDRDEEEEKS